ncbi:accelerated cell death 11-like [Oryza brachyantha]|uniref:Glycolipid transfer protein domain-containing protein n=1 Tax=Oryza brachyantha TaxID=4533 RepID=J3MV77_ORYBR|nr:accelerated cell death 11-like [Oryza brachyantha]
MAEVQVGGGGGGGVVLQGRRPLAEYAAELEALSESVRAAPPLRLRPLVQACHHALAFFDLLGVEAAFWKTEYTERLVELERASEAVGTAEELVDRDVAAGRVTATGTHSNNLVRVKRGIELKRALFQLMLAQLQRPPAVVSFDGLVSMAYAAVFARYHDKNVQSTVADSICAIPVKSISDFFATINETHESAAAEMHKYIEAANGVISYIDELFASRGLSSAF